MNASIKKSELNAKFKPFNIELAIENESDLLAFAAFLNMSVDETFKLVKNHYPKSPSLGRHSWLKFNPHNFDLYDTYETKKAFIKLKEFLIKY